MSSEANPNARLETFCDGVFAIALTLLILDIKIPASSTLETTADVWRALGRLLPSVCAFVLSFVIILITWVNHHGYFKLVNRSSASFLYANGFMLLTIVAMPFPTSLLGEYVLTDHAAPAVVVYDLTIAIQSFAWVTASRVALKNGLVRNDHCVRLMQENYTKGLYAMAAYSAMAVAAFAFPLTVALVTTLTWGFWLYFGIRARAA